MLTLIVFAWLLQLRYKQCYAPNQRKFHLANWSAGLFIGEDNAPSLSLFQVFLWTVITVWGVLYVFIVAGSLLSLTPEMMGLLGIAGVGSVAARLIAASGSPPQLAGSPAPVPSSGNDAKALVSEMLSTNDKLDLMKLQLFVFTLVIAVYVVARIADTAAFPALDANTLLLLGVSQGVYIGGKLAGTTPLSRAHALKVELDVRNDALKTLKEKQTALGAPPAGSPQAAQLGSINKEIAETEKRIEELKAALDRAKRELGLVPN